MEDSSFSGENDSGSDISISETELKQAYDQLKQENISLKKQFESALSISSCFDELQQKNQELMDKLREETACKLDLENKCNFLIQKNDDIEKQLTNYQQRQNNLSDSNREKQNKLVEQLKEKYEKQIEDLRNQLTAAKDQLQKQEISIKLTDVASDKILLSSKRIYNMQFQTLTDLANFLDSLDSNYLTQRISPLQTNDTEQNVEQQTPQKSPKVKSMKDEIEWQKAIDSIKKKLKRQKEKTKIVLMENIRLNGLLNKNDERVKDLIANKKQEIKYLQTELQHKSEEFELKEHNYKNTIYSLTQRNESLKNHLSSLKKEQCSPR